MQLRELLQSVGDYEIRGDDALPIGDISYNSREVRPGTLFAALPGTTTDGRKFVPEAVGQGAPAVLFEGEFFDKLRATQIRVLGARLALARLAAAFYVHPTKNLYLAGITGTNGKTTITYLMEALWQEARRKTGIVGTVNTRYGSRIFHLGQTTPESRDLQKIFSDMKDHNITHAAMEVSSHALVQQRVSASHFDLCLFTNLSQDHLDFHKTMEEYYRAKKVLFTDILPASEKSRKLAIICREDRYGRQLFEEMRHQSGIEFASYGLDSGNDIFAESYRLGSSATEARLNCRGKKLKIKTPLQGKFNLLNILGAVGIAHHSGMEGGLIEETLAKFQKVPGRLERIEDPGGRNIFVDYAHTPDALKNVLEAIREIAGGKIITVFGCGGDRDRTKRPQMGFFAGSLSDVCVVTSDNPRTENPDEIIKDILPGLKQAGMNSYTSGKGFWVEPDRKKAIGEALGVAERGDILLVAGKGHEDYQIIGTKKYPFSDQEVIRQCLKGN